MGLSHVQRQPIVWTNGGLLSIRGWGEYVNEILSEIQKFSLKKMNMKMSSAKTAVILYRPQCVNGIDFM